MTLRSIYSLTCYVLLLFARPIYAQLYEIKQGDKWGFIDRSGNVIIPPRYDFIYSDVLSRPEDGLFVFQEGEQMGVYQVGVGEYIPAQYSQIQVEADGRFIVWQEGRLGLLNPQGEKRLSPIYLEMEHLDHGIYKIRQDTFWAVWSEKQGHLLSPQFLDIHRSNWGHFIGKTKSGYGLWDSTGTCLFQGFADPIFALSPQVFGYRAQNRREQIGLLSLTGESLFPPQLSAIQPFAPYLLAHQDSSFGLFDQAGRPVLSLQYQRIKLDKTGMIWMKQGNLWGLADSAGQMLIEPIFHRRGMFEGAVSIVVQSGRYGLINRRGDFLTDIDCDRIKLYGSVAHIRRGNVWSQLAFDDQGQIIPKKKRFVIRQQEQDASVSADSLAAMSSNSWEVPPENYGWFLESELNLWGLRDTIQDTIMIAPQFIEVFVVPRHNMSMVMVQPNSRADHKRDRRRCGLVDHRTGRYLLKPSLKLDMIYLQDFDRYPVARAQFSTGGFLLISRTGRIFGPKFMRYVAPFQDGIARICQNGNYVPFVEQPGQEPAFDPNKLTGTWSYLNLRGTISKTPPYRYAQDFRKDLALVNHNQKWGAIDRKYKAIIPARYDSLYYPTSTLSQATRGAAEENVDLICAETKQKRYHVLDRKANLLFSRSYEAMGEFQEGLARYQVGGKWGFVDTLGKEVMLPQYDRVGDFHEGLARVRFRREWGYIDKQGEWVVPASFQQAADMKDGIARVREGRRYGYIRKDGTWLVKSIFVEASDFEQGAAIVRRPEKLFGVIDQRGKWILPQKFEQISWVNSVLQVVNDKELTGFYEANGNIIVPPRYEFVSAFHEGLARFKEKGKYGFLDANLRQIVPPIYAVAKHFTFGLAVVGKPRGQTWNFWWGAINQQGQEVIPLDNLGIDVRDYGIVWADRTDGPRAGWRQLAVGNRLPIAPLIVEQVNPEKVLFEKIQRKYGFTDIHTPRGSRVIAETDRVSQILTTTGDAVVPMQFESISYRDGLYKVVRQGEIGYLDEKGEWVWKIDEN